MNDTAIIIQARTSSTRLKEKTIIPFCNSESILEIQISNLIGNQYNLPIIVATTQNKSDDQLIEKIKHLPVEIFRGDEEDVLGRFIAAADKYSIKKIVRVCADNPFLQINLLDNLLSVSEGSENDYVSYHFEGTPVVKTHWGLFSEWVTINALKTVKQATNEKSYKEHVTNYIYENPRKFRINMIPLPSYFYESPQLRFTIDTEEDFEIMAKLYKKYMNLPIKTTETLISLAVNEISVLQSMKKQIEKNSK